VTDPNEAERFHRLARAMESATRLHRDGDTEAAIAIFESFDEQQKRMAFISLIAMVSAYRAERGDLPDATYGPDETRGF
jgi:hypothetical protein